MKSERILIFELNWLGDILFSFPFLRAIRNAFPDAYITCVVVPEYMDLLATNPWVNDVHALSRNTSITSLMQKMAFVKMIRKEKYDTCFFLKPSRMRAVMAELAGITERIGFSGKNIQLTNEVDMPDSSVHRADTLLALAGAVGVTKADGTYEYFVCEEDKKRAATILHEVGGGVERIVAINPGGNWPAKRWPVENFIELSKRILNKFGDVEIMLTGAEKDVKMINEMVKEIGSDKCYSMAGKTGISELAVLFRKCTLVISADSGPLHLASATGVTTLGLFGPTSPDITGPRGNGENIVIHRDAGCVTPCYVENCIKDYECMRSISVDEVFTVSEQSLQGK